MSLTRAQQLKQACLDLNTAAMKLFDSLDENGVDAPWDDTDALLAIQSIGELANNICGYYRVQAALRLAHLDPGFMAREAKRQGLT